MALAACGGEGRIFGGGVGLTTGRVSDVRPNVRLRFLLCDSTQSQSGREREWYRMKI